MQVELMKSQDFNIITISSKRIMKICPKEFLREDKTDDSLLYDFKLDSGLIKSFIVKLITHSGSPRKQESISSLQNWAPA
jgi:hypothetical protein